MYGIYKSISVILFFSVCRIGGQYSVIIQKHFIYKVMIDYKGKWTIIVKYNGHSSGLNPE
jgi:uncharacterized membrane protein SpoIIM required for sporulation